MAAPPMYAYSVVPFKDTLQNFLGIMDKAEEYAKEKGDNIDDYVELSIHPDMKNLGYQIQRFSDTAKFGLVRVGGEDEEALAMPDTEKTWAEFKARVQKTLDALQKADPKIYEGKEDNEVSIFKGRFVFAASTYTQLFSIPNFYFHVVTAYDILRMKGVPIGKMDYIKPPS